MPRMYDLRNAWVKTCRLTCGYVNEFDIYATLKGKGGLKPSRPSLRGLGQSIVLIGIMTLNLLTLNATSVNAALSKELMNYKLYAYNHVANWDQMECLNWLYIHESNWNPRAHNGNHYGIPQGNSVWLRNANAYQQIEWGLNYIKHRYNNDACLALQHWEKYQWH